MPNKTYQFIGYVANNAGIKFGLVTDVKQTLRFDHKISTLGSKTDPVSFIRNTIAYSGSTMIASCSTDTSCGQSVPVTASVNWSGPLEGKEAIISALDTVLAALADKRDQLNSGFLPNVNNIELIIGE